LRTFEYKAPETIDEAISMLKEAGGSARPLAGGTDLVVQMKERATRFPYPATIVSLDRISELRAIDFSDAGGSASTASPNSAPSTSLTPAVCASAQAPR